MSSTEAIMNLDTFTDVLDEVEMKSSTTTFSPAMSLSDEDSQKECVENAELLLPVRHMGQYGEFRCTEEIPEKYKHVFSHTYFNLVQSKVIDDALYSDKSLVISAPTGSGKTVIFEMAIVRLLMEMEKLNYKGDFKIVYMAPVKALCTEKLCEWYPKFTPLGLNCREVTGDTDIDFSQLKPYKIIITTPEKWDSLTRRWTGHKELVEAIRLFMIDEVHILNDDCRGPVLEVVVSRMKTIEKITKSSRRLEKLQQKNVNVLDECVNLEPHIRFIAVSATVSNPDDVAMWLSTNDKQAVFYKMGDECRPVKVRKIVEGYPCPRGTTPFKFDIILNYKLWPIIEKYYNGKPTLIFCSTRKSVSMTAEALCKEMTFQFSEEQRLKLSQLASNIKDKKLQRLVLNGIGCHHAGLLHYERNFIEQTFRNRDLPILVTTTTLAMGVNLPAHLVIIKSTQQYVNGEYQEYSISTILQMIGRAGRPQFDTEATAVIMTKIQNKHQYNQMVYGCGPLESSLHRRLAEHLNSEVALGTVTEVADTVSWARSTFLYIRAAKEPAKYLSLNTTSTTREQLEKKIEDLCVKAMNSLVKAGMICMDYTTGITPTTAGHLMATYCLDFYTMKLIMKITGTEQIKDLLELVCDSHELSDMILRTEEKRYLNTLNRNKNGPSIRFPAKGKINTRQLKVNCIIQAVFDCIPISDPSLGQETTKILRAAEKVSKCIVAYLTRPVFVESKPNYYTAILNAVLLHKCFIAKLWENSKFVCRQMRGIGPVISYMLVSSGKTSFTLIEQSNPRDLERIMNKNAPAGNMLIKQVSLLPKYQIELFQTDEDTFNVEIKFKNLQEIQKSSEELNAGDNHKSYIIVGDSNNNLLHFEAFRDKELMTNDDNMKSAMFRLKDECIDSIHVHCISSTIVGIDVEASIPLGTSFNETNDFLVVKNHQDNSYCSKTTYNERKRKHDKETSLPTKKNCTSVTRLEHFKGICKIRRNQKIKLQTGRLLENLNASSIKTNSMKRKKTEQVTGGTIENNLKSDDFIDNSPDNDISISEVNDTLNVDNLLEEIENEIKQRSSSLKNQTMPTFETFRTNNIVVPHKRVKKKSDTKDGQINKSEFLNEETKQGLNNYIQRIGFSNPVQNGSIITRILNEANNKIQTTMTEPSEKNATEIFEFKIREDAIQEIKTEIYIANNKCIRVFNSEKNEQAVFEKIITNNNLVEISNDINSIKNDLRMKNLNVRNSNSSSNLGGESVKKISENSYISEPSTNKKNVIEFKLNDKSRLIETNTETILQSNKEMFNKNYVTLYKSNIKTPLVFSFFNESIPRPLPLPIEELYLKNKCKYNSNNRPARQESYLLSTQHENILHETRNGQENIFCQNSHHSSSKKGIDSTILEDEATTDSHKHYNICENVYKRQQRGPLLYSSCSPIFDSLGENSNGFKQNSREYIKKQKFKAKLDLELELETIYEEDIAETEENNFSELPGGKNNINRTIYHTISNSLPGKTKKIMENSNETKYEKEYNLQEKKVCEDIEKENSYCNVGLNCIKEYNKIQYCIPSPEPTEREMCFDVFNPWVPNLMDDDNRNSIKKKEIFGEGSTNESFNNVKSILHKHLPCLKNNDSSKVISENNTSNENSYVQRFKQLTTHVVESNRPNSKEDLFNYIVFGNITQREAKSEHCYFSPAKVDSDFLVENQKRTDMTNFMIGSKIKDCELNAMPLTLTVDKPEDGNDLLNPVSIIAQINSPKHELLILSPPKDFKNNSENVSPKTENMKAINLLEIFDRNGVIDYYKEKINERSIKDNKINLKKFQYTKERMQPMKRDKNTVSMFSK